MNTRAIVTLVIGDVIKTRWLRFCRDNWRAYAAKYGCDLIVIDKEIDTSPRASQRSPSWQKCLVLQQPLMQRYQQVAWIDADILFNPVDAADIFRNVPLEKVGAVDAFGDPSYEENAIALSRKWQRARQHSESPMEREYASAEDVYSRYERSFTEASKVLNAGVWVASPALHQDIMRYVYDTYEERGEPSYFENVPLSYELVANRLVHWLNPKFNHLWIWEKFLHYPFLNDTDAVSPKGRMRRRVARITGDNYEKRMATACATAALLNCHCLHFAGGGHEMELVDLETAATNKICRIAV